MKFILIPFLVLTCSLASGGESDTIQVVKKGMGKTYFYQGGQLKKMIDFEPVMATDGEARLLFNKAKTTSGPANVLGAVGGALVGWPIGTSLGGGEPNWALAGIGAGIIVIAIPFGITSSNYMKKAISVFNKNRLSITVHDSFKGCRISYCFR